MTNRFLYAAPVAALLFLTACGPGEMGEAEVTQPETTGTETAEETAEVPTENGTLIRLTAEGREFFFEGEDAGNPDIVVQQGETVEVTLCVTSGTHNWVVDEFGVATDTISAGDDCSTVEFVADQSGEFEYYCSIGNHRQEGMAGLLIVEES